MNSYLMELLLRAAKVIVVLVERVLEAHCKVTLCSGQVVGSCGSGVVNRWCAVAAECDGGGWRLGQEGICLADNGIDACISRSEERRVGKECRSRWAACQCKERRRL